MTVSVDFVTVADSISKLSITGVTVKDIDQITASRMGQSATLSPRPERFITDITFEAETFGSGATRSATLTYILNYVYYHCPIGSTLNFADYGALMTNLARILVSIITNDTLAGAEDVEIAGVSDVGPVLDPAGNTFHGFVVSVRVKEYIN